MGYKIIFVGLIGLLFFGCEDSPEQEERVLPRAAGNINEVIIIADPKHWDGPIGDSVNAVLGAPMSGLPQDEAIFELHQVAPTKVNQLLKQVVNLIYIITLDNPSPEGKKLLTYLGENTINKIKSQKETFLLYEKDLFAKGQFITFMVGRSKEDFLRKFSANKDLVKDAWLKWQRNRAHFQLYKNGMHQAMTNQLKENFQVSFDVPKNYQEVISDAGFFWLKQPGKIEKNIFVLSLPYLNEKMFEKDSILKYRSILTKPYLKGYDSTTYMETQTALPIFERVVNFKKQYAKEYRGLWMTSNKTRGGPFLSYCMVDEKRNKFIYAEGFVSAPGEDKLMPMKELEAILWTLDIEE